MKILAEEMSKGDLERSEVVFDGPMVKGVVDVGRRLLAVDADLERMLLENGSRQDEVTRRKIVEVVEQWIK